MIVPKKILGQAVPEKSLTKKKVNRQTDILTEKAKAIYPLYTSHTGGIISESCQTREIETAYSQTQANTRYRLHYQR